MFSNEVFLVLVGIFIIMYGISSCVEYLLKPLSNLINVKANDKRIKNSIKMLEIIDDIIDVETLNIVKHSLMVGKPYKTINFDTDVKKIATNAYNGLNKKYIKECYTYTETYIYQYIVRKSTDTLYKYVMMDAGK